MMNTTRAYRMTARADAADKTRRLVLEAAVDLVWRRPLSEIRLDDLAAGAGVSGQTVLRIFGSRASLLDAALQTMRDRIVNQRASAKPGDVAGTVAALFDHYEDLGDFVIRNLADEPDRPELRTWLAEGRRLHRASMERQFAPQLVGRADREQLIDCLAVACDVYVWKLLRRDAGQSRGEAEACVVRMVDALLRKA